MKILFMLALLVSGSAFATGKEKPMPPPQPVVNATALSGSIAKTGDSHATAAGGSAKQGQLQGQAQQLKSEVEQGQEQGQAQLNSQITKAAGGAQKQSAAADGGDSSNTISTMSVSSTRYKVPPVAMAGIAVSQANTDCHGVMGIDVRGAGNDGAGGTSVGVPKTNSKCQRDKYIAEAYLSEDYKTYWQLKCQVPEVWKGRRDARRAMTGERIGKWEAIRECITDAQEPFVKKSEADKQAEKVAQIAAAEAELLCDERIERCEAVTGK